MLSINQVDNKLNSLFPLVLVWCCGGVPCAILACVFYFQATTAFDNKDKENFVRNNSNYKLSAWTGIIAVVAFLIIGQLIKFMINRDSY